MMAILNDMRVLLRVVSRNARCPSALGAAARYSVVRLSAADLAFVSQIRSGRHVFLRGVAIEQSQAIQHGIVKLLLGVGETHRAAA